MGNVFNRRRSAPANRGKSLEAVVLASQGEAVRLVKFPQAARWVGARLQPIKGPVDYGGTVVADGRAIFFDAKECASKRTFSLHESHVPRHQKEFIWMMGSAGAVAGLLIEATELGQYFWLDWHHVFTEPGVKWESETMTALGDSKFAVPFKKIPGVL